MLIEKLFMPKAKSVFLLRSGVFALLVGLSVVFGGAAKTFAQEGNQYEEPYYPAARFAVKEGAKKENAAITMTRLKKATFATG